LKMKRLPSLPTLNKKLWKIFSEYIRRKDADENGMVKCIACGALKHWKEIHAGHYIPKSISLALRFDEVNVNPQCVGCNMFRHGNLTQYAISLRLKHGEHILEALDVARREGQNMKMTRTDYEWLIGKYKQRLADLEAK
jgi:hypothetical protein